MKQASLNLNLNAKKTRKQVFLEQMEQVVPWAALVELIAPYYPFHYTQVVNISHLTIKGAIKWAGHNRSCRALTWETRA